MTSSNTSVQSICGMWEKACHITDIDCYHYCMFATSYILFWLTSPHTFYHQAFFCGCIICDYDLLVEYHRYESTVYLLTIFVMTMFYSVLAIPIVTSGCVVSYGDQHSTWLCFLAIVFSETCVSLSIK